MEQDSSDESLVSQAQQGSDDAFRELVSRHKNYVFAVIGRQLNNREVAEELAQDTFVRAYRALSKFRGDSSFRTWLTRIALNTTRSYFSSRRAVMEQANVPLEDEHIKEVGQSDHDPVIAKELVALFRGCFRKLKSDLREVVSLCGFEEQSYEEVALSLAIPVGTVRSRLNRARLMLKECVKRGGEL